MKVYTAAADNDVLKTIDTSSGATVATIHLPGQLVSGPIVTGDRVTIVVKKGSVSTGYVYKIENLQVVSTFPV